MTQQRFSFLLILLMLVTSVTSVMSYYATVVSQSSSEPIITVTASLADDAASHSNLCSQHNQSDLDCDVNGLCSFFICGYGLIAVAFSLLLFSCSTRYYRKISTFLRSLIVSPEIRPPICSC